MRKRIVEPSPEFQEELQQELAALEARLVEADGRRERSRLRREIRRVRRELNILGPPYVSWGSEPGREVGLPSNSTSDAVERRAERTFGILTVVSLVTVQFGAGITYAITGSVILAVAIGLSGVVAAVVGARVLARSKGTTVRGLWQEIAARQRAEPRSRIEELASSPLWAPATGLGWAVIAFTSTAELDPLPAAGAAAWVGIIGGFSGALLRPRRSRVLNDWDEWLLMTLLGVVAVADGVFWLGGNERVLGLSMGPVSFAFAGWIFFAVGWDRRRPVEVAPADDP